MAPTNVIWRGRITDGGPHDFSAHRTAQAGTAHLTFNGTAARPVLVVIDTHVAAVKKSVVARRIKPLQQSQASVDPAREGGAQQGLGM